MKRGRGKQGSMRRRMRRGLAVHATASGGRAMTGIGNAAFAIV